MPRAKKPPRLWLRPGTEERAATWIILDGGRQHRTGCAQGDVVGAERALANHVARKYADTAREKYREASEVPVAEVMLNYVAQKKDSVKRRKEFDARMTRLDAFWGDKTLNDISTSTCRAYVRSSKSTNQARRELEDLRAACRMAIADNITRHAVTVTLPPKPRGRVAHLDRSSVAKLVWAAYRKREIQTNRFTKEKIVSKKRPAVHVARFILAALYTGTRSSRVWNASFEREEGRPWIDLDNGLFYRSWEGEEVSDKKRAPAIRLPDRLLAHMRRWHRKGARYLCEYHGRPADPKRAFRNLANEVLGEGGAKVVRHTMRHTAATWLMQAGADKWQAAGYLGMTLETLESTYGHHHPDHQGDVNRAFSSGRAGRRSR